MKTTIAIFAVIGFMGVAGFIYLWVKEARRIGKARKAGGGKTTIPVNDPQTDVVE